jgi:hypothetical protein
MTPEQVAMVAFAGSRLHDGRSPGEAFGDLVGIGVEPRRAAVAVCVAAGNPAEVAEQRVREFDDVWPVLEPGDTGAGGSLLETHGFFDVEAVLDDTQNVAASHLRQAVAAAGWLPSGIAPAVFRQLRTGKLCEALLYLEDLGARRWPDNSVFWANLVHAADSLGGDDPSVREISRRCAERLGALPPPPSPG